MQKYQTFLNLMLEENRELFDNFKQVHDAFVLAPDANKERFNSVGSEVLDVIRDWERRLCGKTESGQYGKFSSNLSQKFWDEIRKLYKKIDFVGIK
jgi:hypothetical protein